MKLHIYTQPKPQPEPEPEIFLRLVKCNDNKIRLTVVDEHGFHLANLIAIYKGGTMYRYTSQADILKSLGFISDSRGRISEKFSR